MSHCHLHQCSRALGPHNLPPTKQSQGACAHHVTINSSVKSPPWAPASLGIKAKLFPAAPQALPDLSRHLLVLTSPLLSVLLALLQPHTPPPCSTNTPGTVLPQGLCPGCSLSLEPSSCSIHRAGGQLPANCTLPPTAIGSCSRSFTHQPAQRSVPLTTGIFWVPDVFTQLQSVPAPTSTSY